MPDVEHARMMLLMARKDLTAMKGMHDTQTFASEVFGFHGQQAVEKAAKAALSLLGVVYPRTHDVEELLRLTQEHHKTLPEEFHALARPRCPYAAQPANSLDELLP